MRLVVLFGSRARGDFTQHSDYDVLMVSDEIPKDPSGVSNQLFMKTLNMFQEDVDAVFMNTDVFLNKLEEGGPFILEIIVDGKVLEKDEDFWKRVLQIYSNVRAHYERRGKEWVRIKP
ncbi:DNA polymerase subunit beta [Candidatus Marsarchaeota G2 archaeon ECH_B_SAG-G06]|uniref:DNA polymerase subunit beta n=1 Tax=Candidatus Marsarchaeota G2 archaeon ECH_B_SAG-G06 TaxID=1978166 RepID=A0A2R6C1P8_9ARCH|nr:MAG: DNA polymerase subunit beta [Candidatus Marsarchaeota G2 archaeon ECH_B_SAG-G06]